ncbi:hypothetical protein [Stenotrophomonas rhizophila]|uniref:hypothetical protein n=1 Tax=Stenotrophomonas rhizophila TaxID=216778 RepID=UPI003D188BA0
MTSNAMGAVHERFTNHAAQSSASTRQLTAFSPAINRFRWILYVRRNAAYSRVFQKSAIMTNQQNRNPGKMPQEQQGSQQQHQKAGQQNQQQWDQQNQKGGKQQDQRTPDSKQQR